MASTTPSVADAFRATLDLVDTGLDLMRQNLRRGPATVLADPST